MANGKVGHSQNSLYKLKTKIKSTIHNTEWVVNEKHNANPKPRFVFQEKSFSAILINRCLLHENISSFPLQLYSNPIAINTHDYVRYQSRSVGSSIISSFFLGHDS